MSQEAIRSKFLDREWSELRWLHFLLDFMVNHSPPQLSLIFDQWLAELPPDLHPGRYLWQFIEGPVASKAFERYLERKGQT